MGRKIFVSYKYEDWDVKQLDKKYWANDKNGDFDQTVYNAMLYKLNNDGTTTVRAYVNKLEEMIGKDNIFKGEQDDESLADFKDTTIESKLKEKIYDSTVTIVLISPNMKDNKPEEDQWIPWEISYSLRKPTRNDQTSKRNAVLAVVLPDKNNSYDYYIEYNSYSCGTITKTLKTYFLFKILNENMFNIKNKNDYKYQCNNCNLNHGYYNYVSYIDSVKWDDFIKNYDKDIEDAVDKCKEQDKYDLKINIK